MPGVGDHRARIGCVESPAGAHAIGSGAGPNVGRRVPGVLEWDGLASRVGRSWVGCRSWLVPTSGALAELSPERFKHHESNDQERDQRWRHCNDGENCGGVNGPAG